MNNTSTVNVKFVLRWDKPSNPNCDITHYTISISGGIQGTVTLPPNTNEYIFEKDINLNGKSLFGDLTDVRNENISIRTFQFRISADSKTENLSGVPSFSEASLNKFENGRYINILGNPIRNLNFQFVPEILNYDNNDKTIQVLDLDLQKVLMKVKILQSSGIYRANEKNVDIK